MATLIGNGGHASDISDTMYFAKTVSHHAAYRPSDDDVLIAINDPQIRAKVASELGIRDIAWVHPNAHVTRSCSYGHGTHINYGATMTRTHIGDHCTISPGVTIGGDVVIGDRVFIGAGSTIKNLVTIGSDAFIPMGSIVVRDVAPGERYKR